MPHTVMHTIGLPEGLRAIPLTEPDTTHEIGLVIADRDPAPPLARALMAVAAGQTIQLQGRPRPPGRAAAVS